MGIQDILADLEAELFVVVEEEVNSGSCTKAVNFL